MATGFTKDNITFDVSDLSQAYKNMLYKGVALEFDVKNADGSLDISTPATLSSKIKERFAAIIRRLAIEAQKYDAEQSASIVDISVDPE